MKYTGFSFYFILLLLACSCSVKNDIQDIVESRMLTATISMKDTKIALADEDFGTLVWCASDEISLFYNGCPDEGGCKLITDEGGSTAKFGPVPESAHSPFVALFPYSEQATCDIASSIISTSVPTTQSANEIVGGQRILPICLVGRSDTDNFAFYNCCSGIRFSVSEAGYNKVVLRGNNNEQLAGNITIKVGNGSDILVTHSDQTSGKSVTLESETEFKPGSLYYINIAPTEFSKGFSFEIYKTGDVAPAIVTGTKSYRNVPRGIYGTVLNIDMDGSFDSVYDGINLSADGIANCYIVNAPGDYKLSLYEVMDVDYMRRISNAESAAVLWESTGTDEVIAPFTIVRDLKIKEDFLYFSTPSTLVEGNAVISALGRSGNVLYSWHIWVVDGYDPLASAQTFIAGSDVKFMDRNLGATSAKPGDPKATGLFYQWGRKDPFPGAYDTKNNRSYSTNSEKFNTSSKMNTIEKSVQNPMTYMTSDNNWYQDFSTELWSGTKTYLDPCPSGWKIPTIDMWPDECKFVSDYRGISFENCPDAWVPTAGFLASTSGRPVQYGDLGEYWTTTMTSTYSKSIKIYQYGTNSYQKAEFQRATGLSVRCVKE